MIDKYLLYLTWHILCDAYESHYKHADNFITCIKLFVHFYLKSFTIIASVIYFI